MTSKPGPKVGIKRRDATGHLDPGYARDLRSLSAGRSHEGNERAFLQHAFANDELSEELGEAFVESATSGEEAEPERHERVSDADVGGPFVVTSGRQQFATGADESNPEDGTREPFPRPHGR
jgi:hypothetical protein